MAALILKITLCEAISLCFVFLTSVLFARCGIAGMQISEISPVLDTFSKGTDCRRRLGAESNDGRRFMIWRSAVFSQNTIVKQICVFV